MQPAFKSLSVAVAATLATSIAAWSAPSVQPANGSAALLGYKDATTQRALEQKFDAQLNAADLREWMQRMSAEATHVGSPHDKANAEFVMQQMRSWGWDAQIETF